MSTEYNAVQESIKIALDAADATTNVEYNKTKREHKKLEASVKSVIVSPLLSSPVPWWRLLRRCYLQA